MTSSSGYLERAADGSDARQRCPYAGINFQVGDALAVCKDCGTIHLRESWQENKGCTTYGCSQAPDFRKDQPSLRVDSPDTGVRSHATPQPPPPLPRQSGRSSHSRPQPAPHSPTDFGWLANPHSWRPIVIRLGFVCGAVGLAAPSYWGACLGIIIGLPSAYLAVQSEPRTELPIALAGIGLGLAGLFAAFVASQM